MEKKLEKIGKWNFRIYLEKRIQYLFALFMEDSLQKIITV